MVKQFTNSEINNFTLNWENNVTKLNETNMNRITGSGGGVPSCANKINEIISELNVNNAGAHNSTYRGKNLGSSITNEQYASIKAGTFDDLFIGDYWYISGKNWRIAAFDYLLGFGDASNGNSPVSAHHIAIVPDQCFNNVKMNSTNTNETGYYGSDLHLNYLNNTLTPIIEDIFGEEHILKYRTMVSMDIQEKVVAGCGWDDAEVELLTERMVYGNIIWSSIYRHKWAMEMIIEKTQLPLFFYNPNLIKSDKWYWLRDTVADLSFACVKNDDGLAFYRNASFSPAVRPVFYIYQQ